MFISLYYYTYIEYTLFLESQFEKLSNVRISDIWYEFIYDYHDCDQFKLLLYSIEFCSKFLHREVL